MAHADREPFRFEQCVKDKDVEELVDLHFHRRLAFAFVLKPIEWLGLESVTPMKITLVSIAIGVLAGVVAWFTPELGPWACVVAAALTLTYAVLDCSDGMLARCRGGGSHFGMLMDGIGDGIVGLALFVGLSRVSVHAFDTPWVYAALLAIIASILFHTALYDGIKNRFVEGVTPPSSEPPAPPPPPPPGFQGAVQRVVQVIYDAAYGGARPEPIDPERRPTVEAYRAEFRRPMRLISWVGLGTTLVQMYVAAALVPLDARAPAIIGLVFIAGLGNVVALVGILAFRRAERRLGLR
jgi:phosphatidylglycerophosphate synthase